MNSSRLKHHINNFNNFTLYLQIAKLIQERGDDEDEEEEKKEKKKGLMEKMATAAAINYFEKKYT